MKHHEEWFDNLPSQETQYIPRSRPIAGQAKWSDCTQYDWLRLERYDILQESRTAKYSLVHACVETYAFHSQRQQPKNQTLRYPNSFISSLILTLINYCNCLLATAESQNRQQQRSPNTYKLSKKRVQYESLQVVLQIRLLKSSGPN